MEYKYLVVLEIGKRGYIINQYETLIDAQRMYKKLEVVFDYQLNAMRDYFKQYEPSYILNNDPYIINRYKEMSSNGLVSAYLIEYDNWWKDIYFFMADRSYNPM